MGFAAGEDLEFGLLSKGSNFGLGKEFVEPDYGDLLALGGNKVFDFFFQILKPVPFCEKWGMLMLYRTFTSFAHLEGVGKSPGRLESDRASESSQFRVPDIHRQADGRYCFKRRLKWARK